VHVTWGRRKRGNGGNATALRALGGAFENVRCIDHVLCNDRPPQIQAILRATLFDCRIMGPVHRLIVLL
jgi:hypothetical protein